jgi:hypothetical protein
MPTKLRKLKITRVAVCPQGANYDVATGAGAHILLFKAAEGKAGVAHEDAAACAPGTESPPPLMLGTPARRRRPKRPPDTTTLEKGPIGEMGLHAEPDGDETPPLDYATRGQQYDLWESLWQKWQCLCATYSDVCGDWDEDNVPHLPILVRSVAQFHDDIQALLVTCGVVEKVAPALAALVAVAKAGAPMAGHRLTRFRDALSQLHQILQECSPPLEHPGISAADVTGMPFVMKTAQEGAPPMAVQKNAESDEQHCKDCDSKDCDHPAHDRLKKQESLMADHALELTTMKAAHEATLAELATVKTDLATTQADLAAAHEDSRIAKMSPDEQREVLLASMPELVRKNYLDQEQRLVLIEKANKDLQEKNERLDYIQKTVEFRAIGFVPDDHWEILKAIDAMPEALRAEHLRLLRSAAELLKTSPWMTTVGSQHPTAAGQDGSAEQQILALATTYQKEQGGTLGEAIVAIGKQHPDLWAKDQQEKRFTHRVDVR